MEQSEVDSGGTHAPSMSEKHSEVEIIVVDVDFKKKSKNEDALLGETQEASKKLDMETVIDALRRKSIHRSSVEPEQRPKKISMRAKKMLLTPAFVLNPEYDEELLNELISNDDDSLPDLDIIQAPDSFNPLIAKEQFLMEFEDLPSISDLNTTDEEEEIEEEHLESIVKKSTLIEDDAGGFCDPLTGYVSDTSTEEVKPKVVVQQQVEVLDEEEASSYSSLMASDIEIDDETKTLKVPFVDDEIENMLMTIAVDEAEMEVKETEEQKNARLLREMMLDFLNDIFTNVCQLAEQGRYFAQLKKLLDKFLLHNTMKNIVYEFQQVMGENSYLQSILVDLFKRKQVVRYLTILDENAMSIETLRYAESLREFDELLQDEIDFEIQFESLKPVVLEDLQDAKKRQEVAYKKLKTTILKTLDHSNRTEISPHVDKFIAYMIRKHDQISKKRLVIIKQQHQNAMLYDELETLEQITEELSISNFISKQAELRALQKKIEERTEEEKRMRDNVYACIHLLSSMRDRKEIAKMLFRKEMAVQKLDMKNIRLGRVHLYKLKLKQESIRHQRHIIKKQCGILGMTKLMEDFDKGEEEVKELSENVGALRNSLYSKTVSFNSIMSQHKANLSSYNLIL